MSFAIASHLRMLLLPMNMMALGQGGGSILFLALLGYVGAKAGGAPPLRPVVRVVFWGALAMALIDLLRKSPEPTQPAAQKEEFEDGI